MIAFTNGCFDLFHPGHEYCLKAASQYGDTLVVAVNTDSSVRRLKGLDRPYDDEEKRLDNVCRFLENSGIRYKCFLFESEWNLKELVRTFARMEPPLTLVKGSEYRGKPLTGEQYASRIVYIDRLGGWSTTDAAKNLHQRPDLPR